ncbi:serine/threonine-protein kinase [Sorangium sp. So ce385]|uniref:serine/threonine-protein kinase n=1 Tax=Sorangium sp. So ce385 TaxID=3133308 RepID=UPI003F5BEFA1
MRRGAAERVATNGQQPERSEQVVAAGAAGRAADRDDCTALERRLDEATVEHPVAMGRYLVIRRIGAGGMGVVYEARDRRYGQRIAIKTMRSADPAWLHCLKNEFRSVAELAHDNLAALYEFVSEGDDAYIAMEFIEGVPFVEHVTDRAGQRSEEIIATVADESGTFERDAAPPAANAAPDSAAEEARFAAVRLRGALKQLVLGVRRLHEAGKLHRDIKPANILVDGGGRVVLLDYGLVSDADAVFERAAVRGTPAYMAPEQAAGEPASAASDWYAVGGLLYEALTGRRPFHGSAAQILAAKQRGEPPPPSTIAADIPADLDALCTALLRRLPADRPSGDEILQRLGIAPPAHRDEARSLLCLIGRDQELAALRAARAGVEPGRPVLVHVRGRSGAGKSALLRRFVAELRGSGDALVLAGRCFVCEAVPYKAFDSIIDALARYLALLSEDERAAAEPADVAALARVFPSLARVLPRAKGQQHATLDVTSSELRAQAFRALKELLRRVGARRELVFVVDDLQWGDLDSAHLLGEILSAPEAPALLFVGAYRDDEEHSPFLQEMARLISAERRVIPLEQLPRPAARELALDLLGRSCPDAEAVADAIVEEASGNPFFIEALARQFSESTAEMRAAIERVPSLDGVLAARLGELPQDAQMLLAIVAIAGRSLKQEVALAACGVAVEARRALHRLRGGRLLRAAGIRDDDSLEIYHDRIREYLLEQLAPAVRAGLHLSLGRALEADGGAEPEEIARHLLAGGDHDRAAAHALTAAEHAAAILAFDRAADLYRLVLGNPSISAPERRRIELRLADALVNAGQCADAAGHYLACAEGAPMAESLWLRQCGAEQFLVSGQLDRGVAIIRPVLHEVRLEYPATPNRAVLLRSRDLARLAARGLAFRERKEEQLPEKVRQRLDICWAVARGLGASDMVRSGFYGVRFLLLALRAGERRRIVRGLCQMALMSAASASAPARAQAFALFEAARRLAAGLGDAAIDALLVLTEGSMKSSMGNFRESLARLDEGVGALESRHRGHVQELTRAKLAAIMSLENLGRIGEIASRTQAGVRVGLTTGNLYHWMSASLYMTLPRLACDDVEGARRAIDEAIAVWPQRTFLFQHWLALKYRLLVELYRGEAREVWRLGRDGFRALDRSGLLNIQFVRVAAFKLRADAALAVASLGAARRERALALAEAEASRLEQEPRPDAQASAALVRAALAASSRRRGEALACLNAALERYEAAEMALLAAVVRRQKGRLVGGDEGRALVAAAVADLTEAGIARPERWAAMCAPGFD